MKIIINLLLILLFGSCTQGQNTNDKVSISGELVGTDLKSFETYVEPNDFLKAMTFKTVDEIAFDFDKDQINDEIFFYRVDSLRLQSGKTVQSDDPGDYTFLVIHLSGKAKKDTFLIEDGIKKQFLKEVKMDKNSLVKNDYINIYSSGDNNLLLIEGYTYGNGESSQTLINIYKGESFLIFNDDQKIKSLETSKGGDVLITINDKQGEKYEGLANTYRIKNGYMVLD
ncbi:MAG: hypothetical protein AAGG59_05975 [Bacteroidota bacterium]